MSIRCKRPAEAAIEPLVGSKGESYNNALAETINGLYKADLFTAALRGKRLRPSNCLCWNGYPDQSPLPA